MRGNRFSNLSNDVFRAFKSGNIVEPLALFSVGYDRAIMKKERGKGRRGRGDTRLAGRVNQFRAGQGKARHEITIKSPGYPGELPPSRSVHNFHASQTSGHGREQQATTTLTLPNPTIILENGKIEPGTCYRTRTRPASKLGPTSCLT